ncbi:hypothetical protein SADUNF_Sadunf09G0131300 [Salix dunnii]|uniref:Uncharacterized protein n=1 Tax=Salix dunnii TaxID=1413687 RepID=A0A835JWL6_9ROSI|nr:hypothetical protein SADUNF_Sadunf09G0131300 [Salix dunnii]
MESKAPDCFLLSICLLQPVGSSIVKLWNTAIIFVIQNCSHGRSALHLDQNMNTGQSNCTASCFLRVAQDKLVRKALFCSVPVVFEVSGNDYFDGDFSVLRISSLKHSTIILPSDTRSISMATVDHGDLLSTVSLRSCTDT